MGRMTAAEAIAASATSTSLSWAAVLPQQTLLDEHSQARWMLNELRCAASHGRDSNAAGAMTFTTEDAMRGVHQSAQRASTRWGIRD